MESLEEILKRLRSGQSLGSVVDSLLDEELVQLLRRCAVVRTFDQPLVERVLRPDIPNASKEQFDFKRLTSHDEVEPVATSGFFRLRTSARKRYLDAWLQQASTLSKSLSPHVDGGIIVPPDLLKLCQSLFAYYSQPQTRSDLDRLYQQIIADPAGAMVEFRRQFDAAIEQFDVARADDLIQTVVERSTFGTAELRELCSSNTARLAACTLWSQEFYQTVYYMDRPKLRELFEALLQADSKPWILDIYATGGMGKTMFLRWAISRRCAPAGIPCARIDFDFTSPGAATREPWALLASIAQQLDQQMPRRPFYEMVNEFSHLLPGLQRTLIGASPGPAATSADSVLRQQTAEKVRARFALVLRDLLGFTRPIILILDTVEEAVLRYPTAFLDVIRELETLRKLHPGIRLILSGRYELTKRVPGYAEEFGNQTKVLPLEPFTLAEARVYLLELRGLKQIAPEAIDAAIRKSSDKQRAINPFKLALYAQLFRADPKLTAQQINTYPDADIAFLIQRIVDRIEDGAVRWVLRYGVVPRVLTKPFLIEVMASHLIPVMSRPPGESDDDNPRRDPAPEIWRSNLIAPGQSPDWEGLWSKLADYSAEYAWVSTSKTDAATMVFHTDVLSPMRRMLREYQPRKFAALHRDAINYFEKRADSDPAQWGRWIREAVYHHLQLSGGHPEALDYWFRQIEQARLRNLPQARIELARDIVDEQQDAVGPAVLARAHLELASAKIEQIRGRRDASLWKEASAEFDSAVHRELEARQQGAGGEILPVGERALVEASILQWKDLDVDRAIQVVQDARAKGAVLSEPSRIRLLLLEETLLQAQSAGQAPSADLARSDKLLSEARDLAAQLVSRAPQYASLLADTIWALARKAEERCQLLDARKLYEELLAVAQRYGLRGFSVEVPAYLAELALRIGDLPGAETIVQRGFSTLVGSGLPQLVDLFNRFTDAGSSATSYAKHVFDGVKTWFQQAAPQPEPRAALRLWLAQIRTFGARDQLFEALSTCDSLLRELGSPTAYFPEQSSTTQVQLLTAQAHELRGLVLHNLLLDLEAVRTLETARQHFVSLGLLDTAARCQREIVDVLLYDIGDTRRAESLILEMEHSVYSNPRPSEIVKLLQLKADLLACTDRQNQVESTQQEALDRAFADDRQVPRTLMVETCLSALTVSGTGTRCDPQYVLPKLTQTLSQMEPPSARLALMEGLRSCRALTGLVQEQLLRGFENQFMAISSDDETPNVVHWADVLRVTGTPGSSQVLNHALQNPAIHDNPVAVRRLLRGMDRCGWGTFDPQRVDLEPTIQQLERLDQGHALRAALLLDHAWRQFATGHIDHAQYWARRALERFTVQDRNRRRAGCLALNATIDRSMGQDSTGVLAEAQSLGESLYGSVAAFGRCGIFFNDAVPHAWLQAAQAAAAGNLVPTGVQSEQISDRAVPVRITIDRKNNQALIEVRQHIEQIPLQDSWLAELFRTSSYDLVNDKVLEVIAHDPLQVANWMASLIGKPSFDLMRNSEQPGLQLLIDDPIVAGAPWELLSLLHDSPFSIEHDQGGWIYRSSPASRSMGPPKRFGDSVLIVEPDVGRSRSLSRVSSSSSSSEDAGGWGLRLTYEPFAQQVVTLRYPSLDELFATVSQIRPQLIHLCGTMKQSPSLGVYLDVYGEETQVTSNALNSTRLSDAILRLINEGYRPSIVLDIARPESRSECARQLFLRNILAHNLLRGCETTIIATGLRQPWQQRRIGQILHQAIEQRRAVADACSLIRRDLPSDYDRDDWIPHIGTALFTQDPAAPIFPRASL